MPMAGWRWRLAASWCAPGDRVGLIDAGLGPESPTPFMSGGQLLDSLAGHRVSPDEITDMIFTHLHFDHIGWASRAGAAVFPNATYRCDERDWEYFVEPPPELDQGVEEDNPLAALVGPGSGKTVLQPIADRLEPWKESTTLMPGVDVRLAAGHTPGSGVIVISSGTARAVLLGDVAHCPVELLDDEWAGLGDVDPVMATRTRVALMRELEGQDVPITASHFPGPAIRPGGAGPGQTPVGGLTRPWRSARPAVSARPRGSPGVTKIAILDDYIGVALDYGDWSALPADAEITVYREAIPPERLIEELRDYEVIVITQQRARFPRAVLEGLPRLKLLVCNGRTSNVIDHDARMERGILLCGTAETDGAAPPRPAGAASPTRPADRDHRRGLPTPSEMAWALIFAVAKRIGVEDRVIRAGGWQTGFPIPLAGKTLGLLGAGNLGGAMVPVARALGMEVVAWSPNLTDERCAEIGVTRVTKAELLSSADVLGVFLVFSERSRNTLRAEDLAQMKTGPILVNISRGPSSRRLPSSRPCVRGTWPEPDWMFSTASRCLRTIPSDHWTTSSSRRTSAMSPSGCSAWHGRGWQRMSPPIWRDHRSGWSPTPPTARPWRRSETRRARARLAGSVSVLCPMFPTMSPSTAMPGRPATPRTPTRRARGVGPRPEITWGVWHVPDDELRALPAT